MIYLAPMQSLGGKGQLLPLQPPQPPQGSQAYQPPQPPQGSLAYLPQAPQGSQTYLPLPAVSSQGYLPQVSQAYQPAQNSQVYQPAYIPQVSQINQPAQQAQPTQRPGGSPPGSPRERVSPEPLRANNTFNDSFNSQFTENPEHPLVQAARDSLIERSRVHDTKGSAGGLGFSQPVVGAVNAFSPPVVRDELPKPGVEKDLRVLKDSEALNARRIDDLETAVARLGGAEKFSLEAVVTGSALTSELARTYRDVHILDFELEPYEFNLEVGGLGGALQLRCMGFENSFHVTSQFTVSDSGQPRPVPLLRFSANPFEFDDPLCSALSHFSHIDYLRHQTLTLSLEEANTRVPRAIAELELSSLLPAGLASRLASKTLTWISPDASRRPLGTVSLVLRVGPPGLNSANQHAALMAATDRLEKLRLCVGNDRVVKNPRKKIAAPRPGGPGQPNSNSGADQLVQVRRMRDEKAQQLFLAPTEASCVKLFAVLGRPSSFAFEFANLGDSEQFTLDLFCSEGGGSSLVPVDNNALLSSALVEFAELCRKSGQKPSLAPPSMLSRNSLTVKPGRKRSFFVQFSSNRPGEHRWSLSLLDQNCKKAWSVNLSIQVKPPYFSSFSTHFVKTGEPFELTLPTPRGRPDRGVDIRCSDPAARISARGAEFVARFPATTPRELVATFFVGDPAASGGPSAILAKVLVLNSAEFVVEMGLPFQFELHPEFAARAESVTSSDPSLISQLSLKAPRVEGKIETLEVVPRSAVLSFHMNNTLLGQMLVKVNPVTPTLRRLVKVPINTSTLDLTFKNHWNSPCTFQLKSSFVQGLFVKETTLSVQGGKEKVVTVYFNEKTLAGFRPPHPVCLLIVDPVHSKVELVEFEFESL